MENANQPPFKTDPLYWQLDIFNRSYTMPYAALFLEQGLGKSKIVIDTVCQLYKEGKVDTLLVISNKAVAENWYVNEIIDHIWVGHVCKLWGRTSKSESELITLSNIKDHLRIFCINIEALRSPKVHAMVSRLVISGKTFFAMDESTMIKNPSAVQSRKVRSLAEKSLYRRILSGEPAPNGPIDLYHQYKTLSPEALPGMTKDVFMHMFCQTSDKFFGGRRITQPGKDWKSDEAKELFERMVGAFTFKMKKAEVDPKLFRFPAIATNHEYVCMTPEQEKLSEAIKDSVSTELKDILGREGTIRTDVLISRLGKLHQITSGFVTMEDGTKHSFDVNPKLDTLKRIIATRQEETGRIKPVIIWCHYRYDVDTVSRELSALYPGQVGRIYGGIADHERMTILERFKGGELNILVANQQSIGHGLTLTNADTAIYYSNHYNLEYKLQSRDRIHRLGQKADTCFYYELVMKDSIDEEIMKALESKKAFCQALFQSDWIQKVLGINLKESQLLEVEETLESEDESC